MSLPLLFFEALLAFSVAYYTVFVLSVYRGVGRVREDDSLRSALVEFPFVSVVVAARNEERTIRACLESIFQQDYPADRYEVIVVDDASIDRTRSILETLSQQDQRLHVVSLSGARGKAEAMTWGIRQAKGDIILTTDADCIVGSSWIRTMVSKLNESVVLVAGPVLERDSSTLWQRLSALEYFSLTATTAGLIGIDRPIISSGANLAFRKSAFMSVGGFGDLQSVDDETLLQRFAFRNVGRIRSTLDPRAVVTTQSPATVSAFFRQRVRWASKRGRYEDKSLLVLLVLLYLSFLFLFIGAVVALFHPLLFVPLFVAWIVKVVSDAMVMVRAANHLALKFRWLDFLIAELLHVPYIVVAAPVGQFGTVRWKDRTL